MGRFYTVEIKDGNEWRPVADSYAFTFGDQFRVHMADDVKLVPFGNITGTIFRSASIVIWGVYNFGLSSSALLLGDFNGAYFPDENGAVINDAAAMIAGEKLNILFRTTADYTSWIDWINGNQSKHLEEEERRRHITALPPYDFTVEGKFLVKNAWNGTALVPAGKNPESADFNGLTAVTHSEYDAPGCAASTIMYQLDSCTINSTADWANLISVESVKMVFPEGTEQVTDGVTSEVTIRPPNGEYKCKLIITTNDHSSGVSSDDVRVIEKEFTILDNKILVVSSPTFTLNGAITRCQSNGNVSTNADDNICFNVQSLSYPVGFAPTISARIKEHGTLIWGNSITAANGIISFNADPAKDYDIELTFTDAFGRKRTLTAVAGKIRHESNNQIAIAYKEGKYVEFFWPLLATGGIKPVTIIRGTAALNEYHTPGIYYLSDTSISETLTGTALEYRTCLLIVTGSGNTMYQLAVILTDSATNKLELRSLTYANDAWTLSNIWAI